MSRSYKKYPSYMLNPGIRKKFRTDYNRYIRHKKTDFMNGSHYKKTNASWHAYQYNEVFEGYDGNTSRETMQDFEWQYEKELHEDITGIYPWIRRNDVRVPLPLEDTYEERRYYHWKRFYRK